MLNTQETQYVFTRDMTSYEASWQAGATGSVGVGASGDPLPLANRLLPPMPGQGACVGSCTRWGRVQGWHPRRAGVTLSPSVKPQRACPRLLPAAPAGTPHSAALGPGDDHHQPGPRPRQDCGLPRSAHSSTQGGWVGGAPRVPGAQLGGGVVRSAQQRRGRQGLYGQLWAEWEYHWGRNTIWVGIPLGWSAACWPFHKPYLTLRCAPTAAAALPAQVRLSAVPVTMMADMPSAAASPASPAPAPRVLVRKRPDRLGPRGGGGAQGDMHGGGGGMMGGFPGGGGYRCVGGWGSSELVSSWLVRQPATAHLPAVSRCPQTKLGTAVHWVPCAAPLPSGLLRSGSRSTTERGRAYLAARAAWWATPRSSSSPCTTGAPCLAHQWCPRLPWVCTSNRRLPCRHPEQVRLSCELRAASSQLAWLWIDLEACVGLAFLVGVGPSCCFWRPPACLGGQRPGAWLWARACFRRQAGPRP